MISLLGIKLQEQAAEVFIWSFCQAGEGGEPGLTFCLFPYTIALDRIIHQLT